MNSWEFVAIHLQSSLDQEASQKAVVVGLHLQNLSQHIEWKTL